MSPQRRNAIRTFWLSYLGASGTTPVLAEDGPGLLDKFLKEEHVAAKPPSVNSLYCVRNARTDVPEYNRRLSKASYQPAFFIVSFVGAEQAFCQVVR